MAEAVLGSSDERARDDTPRVAPARHPLQWVASGVAALLLVAVLSSVATNPHFQWPVVGRYLLSAPILGGLALTLELSFLAMLAAVVLGVVLAVMRLSTSWLLRTIYAGYVWLFRSTPVLVQLVFWYNIAALYPSLAISLPNGPTLWHADVNSLVTPFVAAMLGLSLNEAAYMAEIVRGGIMAVPKGQVEAAHSLGMTHLQTLRRVVLPQAMRVIVPPTGNEAITMLKTTSLVSVLALAELFYAAQLIYARNYETIPLLVVASIWYLVLTSLLTILQSRLEARFGKGFVSRASTIRKSRRISTATIVRRLGRTRSQ